MTNSFGLADLQYDTETSAITKISTEEVVRQYPEGNNHAENCEDLRCMAFRIIEENHPELVEKRYTRCPKCGSKYAGPHCPLCG